MEAAPHATVEMNVSFLAGASVGDNLLFEGRTLRIGRSVAFAEAEVRRSEDTLMAKGRFTFVIRARRDA
jgi:acyl-coenzyme A thioesterase PaaI-like protein